MKSQRQSQRESHLSCRDESVEKKRKPAYKPGSVENSHSSRPEIALRLKQPTRTQRGPRHKGSYLVLLQVGFTLPPLLPEARCALTAPFHPYLYQPKLAIGGLLSAALSVGLRPPGITWHLALWSPDFPPLLKSSGDCPADFRCERI